jgi:hypothetical protein
MCRLAYVPIAETGYYPVGCVTGWGIHLFFLRRAREGDRDEKILFVVVFGGGSSSPCQRGCTGVTLGEVRRHPDGRRTRQGYPIHRSVPWPLPGHPETMNMEPQPSLFSLREYGWRLTSGRSEPYFHGPTRRVKKSASLVIRRSTSSEEIGKLDEQLNRVVSEVAPELVAVEGIGTDTAASLLIAVGRQPRAPQERGCLCPPVRGRTHTGVLGQDRPPSSEPTWQP